VSQIVQTFFDQEFSKISADVVSMGDLVNQAIDHALIALVEQKGKLAQGIIDGDKEINSLRFRIEEACVELLATQQPAAGDLRAVIASMHIAVELERMGDYAAGIAKTVILMKEEPLLKILKKIPHMGELGRSMLTDCLQAYTDRDAEKARQVVALDAKMDELYHSVFERLVELMAEKPDIVFRATYLMWCAHNLERIADRAINIAERIVFMVTGDLGEFD
jgi:phosphate transport system protein